METLYVCDKDKKQQSVGSVLEKFGMTYLILE